MGQEERGEVIWCSATLPSELTTAHMPLCQREGRRLARSLTPPQHLQTVLTSHSVCFFGVSTMFPSDGAGPAYTSNFSCRQEQEGYGKRGFRH